MSNLNLTTEDGSTMPSTEIYGVKTCINIGSGNVFNLKWDPLNDSVSRYDLVIKRYDPTLNVYYDILDKNIGLVNKFFVNSDMLPAAPEQYLLHIYVVAHTKNNTVITSNIVNIYVCKGSGTYVKTPAGYIKRALGFVNAPTTNKAVAVLRDVTGKELQILDDDGNPIPLEVEATRLLYSDTWNIAQESLVKDVSGNWRNADIEYDILLTMDGEIITDSNDEQIYVL